MWYGLGVLRNPPALRLAPERLTIVWPAGLLKRTMNKDTDTLMRLSDMARALDVSKFRVQRAICKLGIDHVQIIGSMKIYLASHLPHIREQLISDNPPPRELPENLG